MTLPCIFQRWTVYCIALYSKIKKVETDVEMCSVRGVNMVETNLPIQKWYVMMTSSNGNISSRKCNLTRTSLLPVSSLLGCCIRSYLVKSIHGYNVTGDKSLENMRLFWTLSFHHSDVTWPSWCLRTVTPLFVQLMFSRISRKTSKFQATGLCEGNPPVTGEFTSQRAVMRTFDVFFDLRLKKRLSKNNRDAGDLRRHCAHYDVIVMQYCKIKKVDIDIEMCSVTGVNRVETYLPIQNWNALCQMTTKFELMLLWYQSVSLIKFSREHSSMDHIMNTFYK